MVTRSRDRPLSDLSASTAGVSSLTFAVACGVLVAGTAVLVAMNRSSSPSAVAVGMPPAPLTGSAGAAKYALYPHAKTAPMATTMNAITAKLGTKLPAVASVVGWDNIAGSSTG